MITILQAVAGHLFTLPGFDFLPQGVQDAIGQVVRVVKAAAPAIKDTAPEVATAVTFAIGASTAAAILPLANSANNIRYLFQFLRQDLLSALGLERKRKAWGTVYSAQTKKPIPFAKVELLGPDSRVLEARITDTSGRYGFLVNPGSSDRQIVEIQLRARKDGYTFPAAGITPPNDTILYSNVYIGGIATINARALADFDLPMDEIRPRIPVPGKKPRVTLNNIGSILLNSGFYVGLVTVPLAVITAPSIIHVALLVFFLGLNVPRVAGLTAKPYGVVVDDLTGNPLSFALVTLNNAYGKRIAFTVADERGRYFLLVPKGDYTISAYTPATIVPARNFTRQFTTGKGWVRQKLRF